MKFIAIKTDRVSLNGTHIVTFLKGQEYDGFGDEDFAKLQAWGIAPSEDEPKHHEKPKAHNPVEANKMAHPVEHNKLSLSKKS